MKITKLELKNFRNYETLSLKFNNNMNIFVGDNAQGKTNILESIVILALTKSHRTINNSNIVMFDKNMAKIKGVVKNDKIIKKLEIRISKNEKQIFINNDKVKKIADYISNLGIIVFTPDDIDIIKGSPNIRRNLLNIQLSQISKEYLNTYNEYNKILKTRNEYLKVLFNNSIADKSYLDIITDKLVEKAIVIYNMRNNYVEFINENINYYFKNIMGEDNLFINYVPNVEIDDFDHDILKEKLLKKFKDNYIKEQSYGMTLYGPHRDDFEFVLNEINLKLFGSQGQQKVAVLSYKLSEINIFNNYTGTKPVLLLDDIFSELDIKKRNRLLKIINNDIQSIVTTTDLKNINKKYLNDAYVFYVKNGKIERK